MFRRWSIRLIATGTLIVFAAAVPVGSGAPASGASARIYGVKIITPDRGVAGSTEAAAPPSASLPATGFSYPEDGSIARVDLISGSVTATSDTFATSSAKVALENVRLFGGEIAIGSMTAAANAFAAPERAGGDVSETTLTDVTFGGQPVTVSLNGRVELGDWGYMQTLVQTVGEGDPGTTGHHESLRALDVHITADHGGLLAGSEIIIGWVDAQAQASPETQTATIPGGGPKPGDKTTEKSAKNKKAKKAKNAGPPVLDIPPDLQPKLSRKGYVFPVYGQAWYSASFGAPRADTIWHHGIDIFAPMGTPLLAVAKGTVFSVGWNNLGGNRLWLRDREGNEFYYAHLSAFSPLAVNGKQVGAGAVLGFMGHSGDAITTPPHLHFEVHTAARLILGYDESSVDPYEWLVGLEHLLDVEFPEGTADWASEIATGASSQQAGAVLLHSTDISALPRLDTPLLDELLSLGGSAKERSLASD